MLVLLQYIGWLVLAVIIGVIVFVVSYYTFMSYGGYRWSIRSVIKYLSSHGRGWRTKDNVYIVGVDIDRRLSCVRVFALVAFIASLWLAPNWIFRIGFVIADAIFILGMSYIELLFVIHIARLESLEPEARVAYFRDIDSDNLFEYVYDEGGEALLCKHKTYLVANYGIFSMFAAINDYEWG